MGWFDKVDELASEMFAKLIDYANENPNNDYVKYDGNDLMLYIGNTWEDEYSVNIYHLAELLDDLEIK